MSLLGKTMMLSGKVGTAADAEPAVSTKPDVATKAPASRTLIARPDRFPSLRIVDVPTAACAGLSPAPGAASIQEPSFPLRMLLQRRGSVLNGRSHQVAQRRPGFCSTQIFVLLNADLRRDPQGSGVATVGVYATLLLVPSAARLEGDDERAVVKS